MTFTQAVDAMEAVIRPLLTTNLVQIYKQLDATADSDILRTAIQNILDERNENTDALLAVA